MSTRKVITKGKNEAIWLKESKAILLKNAKKTLKERSARIERVVNEPLKQKNKQFKVPEELNQITASSIEKVISEWGGVDMKASNDRRENRSKKNSTKKNHQKRDLKWYKSAGKSWFNQRVWWDAVFGSYWLTIVESIKKTCGNDETLFLQCLEKLFDAHVEFGKTTKPQTILQSSIINKSKALIKFLRENNVCDVDQIKKIGKRKVVVNGDNKNNRFGAKEIRRDVLHQIQQKITQGTMGYGATRGMNIVSVREHRWNPLSGSVGIGNADICDFETKESAMYPHKVNDLERKVEQLQSEIINLRKEKEKLAQEFADHKQNELRKQQSMYITPFGNPTMPMFNMATFPPYNYLPPFTNTSAFPPSIDNRYDNGSSIFDSNTILPQFPISSMPQFNINNNNNNNNNNNSNNNKSQDNSSVSTKSESTFKIGDDFDLEPKYNEFNGPLSNEMFENFK